MKVVTMGMTALFLATGLAGIAASRAKSEAAKKTATQVKYKAACGMIYSAADAKEYRYICPMDKKPLKKILAPAGKSAKSAQKPAAKSPQGHRHHGH